MLMRRVRRDIDMWLAHGIGISCWSLNEDTGVLEIGVRTPTAQAAGPLRRAYGPGTHVYYADIHPAR
jgi:hypothetical protein